VVVLDVRVLHRASPVGAGFLHRASSNRRLIMRHFPALLQSDSCVIPVFRAVEKRADQERNV